MWLEDSVTNGDEKDKGKGRFMGKKKKIKSLSISSLNACDVQVEMSGRLQIQVMTSSAELGIRRS